MMTAASPPAIRWSHFGCWQSTCIYDWLQCPSHVIKFCDIFFWHCPTKHPLDKLDSDFWPCGSLNDHISIMVKSSCKIKSLWSCRESIPLYFLEWTPKHTVALFKLGVFFSLGEEDSMFSSGRWGLLLGGQFLAYQFLEWNFIFIFFASF